MLVFWYFLILSFVIGTVGFIVDSQWIRSLNKIVAKIGIARFSGRFFRYRFSGLCFAPGKASKLANLRLFWEAGGGTNLRSNPASKHRPNPGNSCEGFGKRLYSFAIASSIVLIFPSNSGLRFIDTWMSFYLLYQVLMKNHWRAHLRMRVSMSMV